MDEHGRPAADLSDEDLEQQGAQAHATRNWVFLHGTAPQFRRHTERMLELEQEYLRRHPKRTWQGAATPDVQLVELDEVTRLRAALHGISAQISVLLSQAADPAPTAPGAAETELLTRVAAAPGGRLHKLEVHQAAREVGLDHTSVARLYRGEVPLLATDGESRVLTPAGQQWLDRRTSAA